MFEGKTILISALDWGLGHATRCVPVIRELQKNNQVIIGVTPLTRAIFEEEFPQLQKVTVPAYNIRYSSVLPLWLKLLFSWTRINRVIRLERQFVEEQAQKLDLNVIISDNRFGFYSEKIHSVFITHQLFLKTPFAAGIAQKINRGHVLHFNEVWVPDYEDAKANLSGDLSHGDHYHQRVKYIGPQSRLNKQERQQLEYDVLIILSGPEPHQSILGKKMLSVICQNPNLRFAMVSNTYIPKCPENLAFYGSPSSGKLSQLIAQSEKIVCRSGYSTLMDLHLLGKTNLILIPTPGQTEQEYLAKLWCEEQGSTCLAQKDLPQSINLIK